MDQRDRSEISILLVEDNPDDQFLTLRTLRKHQIKGEVVVASDALEALDYLFARGAHEGRDRTKMPQLILLDLNLPRIGGLELLKRIREDERTWYIPVVILTSSVEQRDVVAGYRLGANSYIRKPVDSIEFSEAVRQVCVYWGSLNELPLPGVSSQPALREGSDRAPMSH